MITKFLKSLEIPDRPLLSPNYWSVTKLGFLLPKNVFKKWAYICLHELVTFFVFTQYMELFVIRSNIDKVLTNMKISMLSIVCIVKSNTYVMWQNEWIELFDYVTAADIEERNTKDPIRAKIVENYTRYCRKITYFYWALVFTTFVTVCTTPGMLYLSENYMSNEIEQTEPFFHIFSSWMPFDKYSFPGCWITVVWHIFMCGYGAWSMAAYDVTAIVVMVFFGEKFDLFRIRCKELFVIENSGIDEERTEKLIRKMHRTFLLMIKYSKLFNDLLSPVMFLYVVMCSFCLCASAYQLTSAHNATEKLLMAEYLIFGIAQLFMFCWHSNDVLYKSREIMTGPYESEWWQAGVKQRKSMILLAGQLNNEVCFSAGPFAKLSLGTFINILKGSYSYYTLLRK